MIQGYIVFEQGIGLNVVLGMLLVVLVEEQVVWEGVVGVELYGQDVFGYCYDQVFCCGIVGVVLVWQQGNYGFGCLIGFRFSWQLGWYGDVFYGRYVL